MGDTARLQGTAGRDTARAREQFLSHARDSDPEVRRMILASWICSCENKVCTDRLSVPYVRDPDLDAPLCRSAAPILDTLGTQLQGESVSIILTDHTGLVLDRRCSSSEIVGQLDAVRLAPGFSYAEEFAGTNGIGTALSTGGLALVDGREHYSHELGRFACAGAPIKHPTRGKIVGVLDLTTWSEAPGAMLTALARATAKQIEEELLAQTGLREFALFADYLKTSQHSAGPVLALNNDVVMMNDHLRQLLDPAEQESLIGYAMDTMRAGSRATTRTVELPSGRSAHLRCTPATCETGPAGGVFVIRLGQRPSPTHAGAPHSSATRVGAELPGLVGAAPCWTHTCQQIDACYQAGDWVAVDGEPGVGKLALLRAVHRKHHPAVRFRVVEPPHPDGLDDWLSVLSEDLQLPNAAIVLAHVNGLDDDAAAAVAELLLEQAADLDPSTRPRLAMTVSGDPPPALRPLFPRTVEVPALRHHLEDLTLLVPQLLAQLARGAHLECSPQALAQLGRLNWPGNIAQLRAVLSQVVKRRPSGVIEVDDLPPECRSATRRTLSQLESLERDAIVNALISSDENPTKAAATLGISRATIYRKLRTYNITLPLAH